MMICGDDYDLEHVEGSVMIFGCWACCGMDD